MIAAANSNRFGFCLGTLLSRQRSDTSGANRSYKMRLMIASEFRSQARPLKTVTRAVAHAIGDSVLYHSVPGLARGEVNTTALLSSNPRNENGD
jgi:hypothetical protein